jgi:hypothetical protein
MLREKQPKTQLVDELLKALVNNFGYPTVLQRLEILAANFPQRHDGGHVRADPETC